MRLDASITSCSPARLVFPLLLLLPAALFSQSYDDRIAQARQSLRSGQVAAGQSAAQSAIQADPDRWEGYVVAGTALSMQGRNAEAIRMLDMALARAPEVKKQPIREMIAQVPAPAGTGQQPMASAPTVMPRPAAAVDANAIWVDPGTGKMYSRDPSPDLLSWNEAVRYCRSLTLGGFTGWRLPDYSEEEVGAVRKNRDKEFHLKRGYNIWTGAQEKQGKTAFLIPTTKLIAGDYTDKLDLEYQVICVRP